MAVPKCPCIDPGKLRHRVSIVRPEKTRDDMGHVNETFPVLASGVPAAIEPASTADIWQAAQVQTKITHQITIRYRSGITGEMQVKFRGRTFNVIGEPLNPEETNVLLILFCCEAGTVAA